VRFELEKGDIKKQNRLCKCYVFNICTASA